MNAAQLELRALGCMRSRRRLFSDLGLTLTGGQLLRVLGPNGAGKTSLLRMVCGLLLPAEGQVLWQDQSVATLREEFGRQLIYLGHAAALKDDLTALENLQAAAVLGGSAVSERDAAAALAQAGLRGRERALARTLSQGQRKRVALARLALESAVVRNGAPALWVLDEPFNALDTAATTWLIGLVTDHLDRGGIVVLTSHQSVEFEPRVRQVRLAL